jgi:enoyl-CoA hydratase/carnithine racemase
MRDDAPMNDQPELVRLDVSTDEDGVAIATITLDSQHNRNAISRALQRQLMTSLDAADLDESVRAVVIRADGPVFCAGADMSEAASGNMEKGTRRLVALQRKIVTLDKPVIARVHGPVRAGGLGLVAACDAAISADSVSYAFTEVRLGLAPAVISLTVLPRLTDRAAARYFLTADTFDAAEAERIGLITRAVPADQLDEAVDAIVDSWRQASAQGLRETKALLNRSLVHSIDELGEQVVRQSARLFGSDEAIAAMSAFLDKRDR